MAQFEVRLPKMGESVTEATITGWLKDVGDSIDIDEPLVEVATDKVDNELPSEVSGVVTKRLFEKDSVAQVGDVIAIISTDGDGEVAVSEKTESDTVELKNDSTEISLEVSDNKPSNEKAITIESNGNGRFYSPLVRSIANKEGINQSTLDSIKGSGKDNRVTKKDILSFLANKSDGPISENIQATKEAPISNANNTSKEIKAPVVIPSAGDEIIEMDRMRKLIADHMVMSKHVSPHVTSYVEADVTNLVEWRNKIKNDFFKREGEKITFTPIFIEAVVRAIKDFPMVNVSVNGTQIIKKKDINIGMATALPSGNLIVPVIKNADMLNLSGLTKNVNLLANNARNNKLKPEDIQGGTYTITNVGTFGNVMGTPIINQPQVAILAVGAIRKVPAVIETENGDFIGIRHKMFLSHSYDHRVVDGALGGQFVRKVADYLEQFDKNRVI
ncbi:MAG: diapophytoene dehydrogenase [Crocinitomicaceae bacterium]|nr:diapophytoene dehydrogenase [Crocinitomicaceae bacterium]